MQCFVCNEPIEKLEELIFHLKQIEKLTEGAENFLLHCAFPDCPSTFVTFYGFTKHLHNFHKQASTVKARKRPLIPPAGDRPTKRHRTEFSTESPAPMPLEGAGNYEQTLKILQDEIQNFFVQLSGFAIPEEQQSAIERSLEEIFDAVGEVYQSGIRDRPNTPLEVLQISRDLMKKEIRQFNSKELRRNFFSKLETYVAPTEHCLKTRVESTLDAGSGSYVKQTVECCFIHIKMRKILESALKIEEFRSCILNPVHKCVPGVYKNVCCGKIVQEECLDPNTPTIFIELYYDETETCDGLKNRAGVNKLGQFYFKIKNLDPSLQSLPTNVHLLASFYYVDIQGKKCFEISSFSSFFKFIKKKIKFFKVTAGFPHKEENLTSIYIKLFFSRCIRPSRLNILTKLITFFTTFE